MKIINEDAKCILKNLWFWKKYSKVFNNDDARKTEKNMRKILGVCWKLRKELYYERYKNHATYAQGNSE